jgi:stage II sporulation protein R
MKYKKLILILSLFIITFTYIIHPWVEENLLEKKGFEDEIIRFHIRANSDKEEDQGLKLKIRDEILKEMKEKFKDTASLDESREIIKANMEEMKSITENVIEKEGEDYSVEVTLGQDNFPTRKYGNLVFPAGDYETLLITLGEGKGQNWWCVMFPPLCFVDITHSVAYNLEKQLQGNEEEVEEIEVEETKEEEQPKLKLKWKIVDLFKSLME